MKKKILIVENFVHFRNAVESIKLFSLKYDCKLIINKKHKNKIEKKFQNKIIFFSGPKFLIYFYILIISNKYDYIIISTLPEYPENLNNLKNILFTFTHYLSFFISFSNIKSKLIFQIRNINAFVPRKKTFLTNLRNILLNLSNKYIFENKYLANKYKNRNNFKNKKISYQYINHVNSENGKIDFKNNYIGILGGIDASKKDYDLLFYALKRLFKKRFKFNLIFLGKLVDKNSINIIKRFSIFKIKFFKKYISEKEFKYWGFKCRFLISPLKTNSKYGSLKPTGSFGDSIYLKRKLIVNSRIDPDKEFRSISIYYNDKNDFYKKIKKALSNKIKWNSNEKFLNKKENIKRIIKDLSL